MKAISSEFPSRAPVSGALRPNTAAIHRHRFPESRLDPDALDIIATLQRAGHTAYFVGGCVRDLAIGKRPKDFDVATDATPQELKRLFRNCRIIGRRFRLAHLFYGSKIIEVATFRGRGSEAVLSEAVDTEEVIERTNTFGTPEQDARSRDFTCNALFYDPLAGEVIDYVDGLADVRARYLRTIGDPAHRLLEDPIRILRAVKFSSRLGFSVHPDTSQQMLACAALIPQCPAPRVTEEVFRLFESGHALRTKIQMEKYGLLPVLLPELHHFLQGPAFRAQRTHVTLDKALRFLDRLVSAHDGVPREFVLAALMYFPWLAEGGEALVRDVPDWGEHAEVWLRTPGTRMAIPARLRHRLALILSVLQRMLYPPRRSRRLRGLTAVDVFPQALLLLGLHVHVFGEGAEAYDHWADQAAAEGVFASPYGPAPLSLFERDDDRVSAGGHDPGGKRRRGGRGRRR